MISTDGTDGHRAFALPGARDQYGPDKLVDVLHIDLHLEPDLDALTLDGVCTTTVRAYDDPVHRLSLNAVDLAVSAVERDGAALAFERRDDALIVTFEPPIAPREELSFRIAYRASKPRHGLFFIEPTPEYPQKMRHAWTQSQDENARYWFPCLDYPHAKQTTQTTVVVRKGEFALANGALIERTDDGETTRFVYRQDVPHSTYLMTFVAGPFVEARQSDAGSRKVPVFYYVLPGRESDGERAFGNTPRMIDAFEERIGTPYPYARYSQIAVTDFIFGGMENTSATTQTDRTLHDERAHIDFSSDPLVSHELAHQWFGDLLTCRDWSHAWLNEGFATYFECVWREADLGFDEYLYDVFGCVTRYLEEDGDRYRRPIVCNRYRDPIELFDRHLYEKGGATLHMLRGELGDERFWRSIRHYVAQNAQRNVETIDLIRAIEEATGRNMRGFFDQWVFRGGHPRDRSERRMGRGAQRGDGHDRSEANASMTRIPPTASTSIIGFCAELPQSVRAERRARAARRRAPRSRRGRTRARNDHDSARSRAEARALRSGLVSARQRHAMRSAPPLPRRRSRAIPIPSLASAPARALVKNGSQSAREALDMPSRHDPFWGVLEELAGALGKTKAPWAREILISSMHDARAEGSARRRGRAR